jgi:tripartite-type tricarboxylate transporter receptor subunit TctC
MTVSRRGLAAILAAACLATAADAARADDPVWPQRAVRLVAAQQAGSATDRVARILADFLVGLWKQPVVVDNRPGASGAIGTQIAARAEPDGYTLLVGGTSSLVTHPKSRRTSASMPSATSSRSAASRTCPSCSR